MKSSYRIREGTDAKGRKLRAYLYQDAAHSAIYLDEELRYQLVFPYNRAFLKAFELFPKAENVLVIGGGMYTLPAYLIRFYPHLNVDVLEPDRDTVELAKKHFRLDELYRDIPDAAARLNIIHAYGREYLAENEKKYDVILNDAFAGYDPAYDLMSSKAAMLIRSRLNENGIYAANLLGSEILYDSDFMLDEMKTLLSAFAYTDCLEARDEGAELFCNYVVFASDKDYFQNPYIEELLQGTEVIADRDTPHLKEFYEVLSFVSGR